MTRKRVTNCLRHRTFQFTGAIITYSSSVVNGFSRIFIADDLKIHIFRFLLRHIGCKLFFGFE